MRVSFIRVNEKKIKGAQVMAFSLYTSLCSCAALPLFGEAAVPDPIRTGRPLMLRAVPCAKSAAGGALLGVGFSSTAGGGEPLSPP